MSVDPVLRIGLSRILQGLLPDPQRRIDFPFGGINLNLSYMTSELVETRNYQYGKRRIPV